ncbi:MAG TPA: Ig-like domain repeat protein [Terracidiphilus sp.]|nr:Ig-like domain repeat protein [Terracidiphilus sp.]
MSRLEIPQSQSAGVLICAFLLAITPNHAQEINQARPADRAQQISTSIQPPKSIISLAYAPRPRGEVLARRVGDATFEHVPANYHVFAAATMGEDAGVETLTLDFAGETTLTRIESKSKDFVVEPGGTCHEGNAYGRGDSCSLQVRFNPQGPGHRLGFVNISNSAEATAMNLGLTGNGYAPVVSFTPSQIMTVPGTAPAGTGIIKSATNMAIDGGDILYIADIGNAKIKEIDSTGAINSINPAFATPQAVAVDSAGIIYSTNVAASTYYFSDFTPWGVQTAFGYTYTSTTCTPSAPCAFSTVGMSSPANVVIDNSDNLFMLEGTTGSAEMPVQSLGQGTGTLNLWHLKNQYAYASGGPGSFAVDAYGDLFTNYTYTPNSTCVIYYEPLYDSEYNPSATRVAGGVKCGFSGDGGQGRGAEISTKIGQMAFDAAGNFYFADTGNQRIRRIDNTTGIISTIAGNGTAGYTGDGGGATLATLSNPTGVAVDSQGQVYILSNAPSGGPTQALRVVNTTGKWVYQTNQVVGTPSLAKVFTVSNTGNSLLTLAGNAFLSGPTPGDFTVDTTTTTCGLTTGATLAAGRSCNLGIIFTPKAAGWRSAILTLLDNTVNGSNSIQVGGTGILASATHAITSPAGGSSVTSGTTVTFAVSVTSASTPKPSGTVTFKVNGTAIGSPVTLSSGAASTTFKETTASAYTLSAVYSGDTNFASSTASETLNVTPSPFPANVSLTPVDRAYSACGAVSLQVKVSSAGGPIPTGTVELMDGSVGLASATLSGGAAILAAGARTTGSHTLVASYSGDGLHPPATSAPVSVSGPLAGGFCGPGHQPALGQVRVPVDR